MDFFRLAQLCHVYPFASMEYILFGEQFAIDVVVTCFDLDTTNCNLCVKAFVLSTCSAQSVALILKLMILSLMTS